MANERCYLLIAQESGDAASPVELRDAIENGDIEQKIEAMKRVIASATSGEHLPQLLMPIIRCIMPQKNHTLKKLLLLYWEVVPKVGADGKLLTEFILVCNNLRNDLLHPNEFIRGSTLRYLAKLREPELLEPLLPSVRSNLEHRHSYVRRNALTALHAIYSFCGPTLCPDAPDLVYSLLLTSEPDAACRRNAFLMLCDHAPDKAADWVAASIDQLATFADILQFVIVEFIRKLCCRSPAERPRFLRCLWNLLQSPSQAVQFEAASTLVALTSAPSTVTAAASAFIQLLCKHSDNNVKMIVLDKLNDIKSRHPKVMEELTLDMLRAFASPNMDIRQKVLKIAIPDLVTPRNIDQVILVLKKEINRTQSGEIVEKPGRHRQMLIQAIHQCAVRFSSVASNVIHVLVEFLGDKNVSTALEVILFVREVVETFPDLRDAIMRKVVSCFDQIQSAEVFRYVMWLIGEYSTQPHDVALAVATIKQALGVDVFATAAKAAAEQQHADQPADAQKTDHQQQQQQQQRKPRTLADGTYATQSALTTDAGKSATGGTSSSSTSSSSSSSKGPRLHTLIHDNADFYLASVVATTLTKLALRSHRFESIPVRARNQVTTEVLLAITCLLRFAEHGGQLTPDNDCYDRMLTCIQALLFPSAKHEHYFLVECHSSFAGLLAEQQHSHRLEQEKLPRKVSVQPDDLLQLRHLQQKSDSGLGDVSALLADELGDLAKALGLDEKRSSGGDDYRLNRVFQLTGYSDPIYAEAFVHVHQYDIVLDVLVVNQTSDTLQNVSLELATLGDLKLCERPQSYTIGPKGSTKIRASIKVSSTETGVIFGNLVYDVAGTSSGDKNCVVLADIHIDIMDYIQPAACSEIAFQKMWASFEWENKVSVNTSISSVKDFLAHIIQTTNMKCLTPLSAMAGDCGFLAANLYARSIFGEDALANIGIERQDNGRIVGHIRIRSKTQGIALSLGDRITVKQRSNETDPAFL